MLCITLSSLEKTGCGLPTSCFTSASGTGENPFFTDPFLFEVDFEVESGYIWSADAMPLMPVVLWYQTDWWVVSLILRKKMAGRGFCNSTSM
jgi:hypothetical protein